MNEMERDRERWIHEGLRAVAEAIDCLVRAEKSLSAAGTVRPLEDATVGWLYGVRVGLANTMVQLNTERGFTVRRDVQEQEAEQWVT